MDKNIDRMVTHGISERDLHDFMECKVWICICEDLRERLEITRNNLENAPLDDTEKVVDGCLVIVPGLRRLQGAAAETRYLLDLPSIMLSDLLEIKKAEVRYEGKRGKGRGDGSRA